MVVAEPGGAVDADRQQPAVLADDPLAEEPVGQLLGTLQPDVPGRHRQDDVVAQQADEGRDVVALEGVDVAGQQGLLPGVDRGVEHLARHRRQGGPGPLQGTVDRSHRRAEQLGHLGGLPLEHFTQDQHGALACGEVLQGGDEGETDRFPGRRDLGGVALEVDHALVGNRLDVHVFRQLVSQHDLGGGGGRPHLHWPGPALRAPQHVDADVVGDAVQPGSEC